MTDTDQFVEGTLAHYGVKGMRWGVRKSDRLVARAAPSSVKTKTQPSLLGSQTVKVKNRAGGKVTTKGGGRNVASEDAVKTAVSRQKARKSSTSALSNKELQDAITRMNLEKQYSKLDKENRKATRGKRFTSTLLQAVGDIAAADLKTQTKK